MARSVIVRTKNGVTNRPVAKLYPLELSDKMSNGLSNSGKTKMKGKSDDQKTDERPQHYSAKRARQKVAEWMENAHAPGGYQR